MPTFLHAADLHLDSPLLGLESLNSLQHSTAADRVRSASRTAMQRLVQTALDEEVAFVVLAGDVLDGLGSLDSSNFLRSELGRLNKQGIRVFVTLGNHDHAGLAPGHLAKFEGVHVFSKHEAECVEVEGAAIHGRSYAVRDERKDLSSSYRDPIAARLNIGVLHTMLEGTVGHDDYAPSKLNFLASRGYAYWALGHVHARSARVEKNGVNIVYPGNLQGRHARELGPKGGYLVDYAGARITGLRFVPCDTVRWHRVEVLARDTEEATHDAIKEAVEDETREARGLNLGCPVRVVVRGTHAESARWRGAAPEWRERLRDHLVGEPDVWIEKLKVEVDAPDECAPGELAEARALIDQAATDLLADPDARERLFAKVWDQVRSAGDSGEWIERCVSEVLPPGGSHAAFANAVKAGLDLLAAKVKVQR